MLYFVKEALSTSLNVSPCPLGNIFPMIELIILLIMGTHLQRSSCHNYSSNERIWCHLVIIEPTVDLVKNKDRTSRLVPWQWTESAGKLFQDVFSSRTVEPAECFHGSPSLAFTMGSFWGCLHPIHTKQLNWKLALRSCCVCFFFKSEESLFNSSQISCLTTQSVMPMPKMSQLQKLK